MNKKYKVKAGTNFDPNDNLVVTILHKTNPLNNWKIVLIIAVFSLLLMSGVYATISGDISLFHELCDTLAKITEVVLKG